MGAARFAVVCAVLPCVYPNWGFWLPDLAAWVLVPALFSQHELEGRPWWDQCFLLYSWGGWEIWQKLWEEHKQAWGLQRKLKPPEVPKPACRIPVPFRKEFKLTGQAQPAEVIPFQPSAKGRARPLHSSSQGGGSAICSFTLGQKRLKLHFCTPL